MSVEQAIQKQNFPNAGVPVLLGSNLDEGSTFMCVGDRTTILALAIVNQSSPRRQTEHKRFTRQHHTLSVHP